MTPVGGGVIGGLQNKSDKKAPKLETTLYAAAGRFSHLASCTYPMHGCYVSHVGGVLKRRSMSTVDGAADWLVDGGSSDSHSASLSVSLFSSIVVPTCGAARRTRRNASTSSFREIAIDDVSPPLLSRRVRSPTSEDHSAGASALSSSTAPAASSELTATQTSATRFNTGTFAHFALFGGCGCGSVGSLLSSGNEAREDARSRYTVANSPP